MDLFSDASNVHNKRWKSINFQYCEFHFPHVMHSYILCEWPLIYKKLKGWKASFFRFFFFFNGHAWLSLRSVHLLPTVNENSQISKTVDASFRFYTVFLSSNRHKFWNLQKYFSLVKYYFWFDFVVIDWSWPQNKHILHLGNETSLISKYVWYGGGTASLSVTNLLSRTVSKAFATHHRYWHCYNIRHCIHFFYVLLFFLNTPRPLCRHHLSRHMC